MIQIEFLKEILLHQHENILSKDTGMAREQIQSLPDSKSHALIVSGIRRCGKSTLLFQLLREKFPDAIYLNFDDPRLYDFGADDFNKLDKLIGESSSSVLMFDEIQLVNGWERYVRQKLDENYRVFVTGSNASLLSSELGSSLTGRQITKELFPFSYSEYCRFRQITPGIEATLSYMKEGGFPEYLKRKNSEILTSLLNDILVRDIAVRYNIRDVRTLQRLTLFLLANVGNRITGNKLKNNFGISSTTTILEYFSYLEQCYLLSFVPMFDYSLKKQNVYPKKVYAIDSGLVENTTPRFKSDDGHKLENLIFLFIREKTKDIFYYSGSGECDFLVMEKGVIAEAIQVCLELDTENLQRETSGLFEAMKKFQLDKGTIVTLSQSDSFSQEEMKIEVIPFHEYCRDKQ
ncbi:MAG: AAA family ATPase [Bacteroidetes bacterium GWF2_42_66]|nr:MAG: AAA family ATPase [Bacteroidetes bacterium GWA2_42_15]OFY01025.1 MAG: AAA family ATPase [Bacteroidetes bacterium GWE2_42_39]OFY41866.1 MAG: AAA family ATPase [Bacteroidetes bacterium GWF2_42_66]HBL77957.1 AAA family ATPase [Prolixibacteraceae bacterium]HCR90178.1 AAA family ATPase [Prolixibacteraceae bacterium]